MPFLFVGGIVSSQCSDESGLCWRIRSGEVRLGLDYGSLTGRRDRAIFVP